MRTMRWTTRGAMALLLLVAACADDGAGASSASDAATDVGLDASGAGAGDTAGPSDGAAGVDAGNTADAAPDSTDAGLADVAGGDAAVEDVAADAAAGGDATSADGGGADADVVVGPKLPHFALSVIHFNIQYVCGGTVGIIDSLGGLLTRPEGFSELDEAQLEDQIIVESFHPILVLLDNHPSWTLTIELQGYMVEIIMARHPDTFALMKTLNEQGRLELVSFHYSDQLFVAGTRESMDRSLAMNEAIFAQAGLTRAGSIFTQEGQFGVGMAPLMEKYGYHTALVPRNLWKFQLGEDAPVAPLYTMRGVHAIVGGRSIDDAESGIQSTWTFFDDGEKLMTNDMDPYISSLFVFHQPSYDEYEKQLLDLEAAGWQIAGIDTYVQAVEEAGIATPELPPILDGSWQPKNSNNMYRWMGGQGVWGFAERDNDVLTSVVRARHAILAAEAAIPGGSALIDQAWRELLLGEVSDATGWNPWGGEVQYGLTHAHAAEALALQALEPTIAAGQQVDLATGEVAPLEAAPAPGDVVDPLLAVVAAGTGWDITQTWRADPDGGATLEVTFAPGEGAKRDLSVVFPFTNDQVVYSPAMLEDEVQSTPLTDYVWGSIGLPCANGMLGLADGLFVVKDLRTVHLAAVIDRGPGTVTYRDETTPTDQPVTWRFLVLDGVTAEQARARADRLNVHPIWRPAP